VYRCLFRIQYMFTLLYAFCSLHLQTFWQVPVDQRTSLWCVDLCLKLFHMLSTAKPIIKFVFSLCLLYPTLWSMLLLEKVIVAEDQVLWDMPLCCLVNITCFLDLTSLNLPQSLLLLCTFGMSSCIITLHVTCWLHLTLPSRNILWLYWKTTFQTALS
jgi:hypothetical protein